MTIPLDRVEPELRRLWDQAGRSTPTRTMTVVALCETKAHVPIADGAISFAAPRHGARSIVVEWRDGEPRIEADVALHRTPSGAPCSERIHLYAFGEASAFVPEAVAQLLAPDLPALVWWVGDLPDHEAVFDRVATIARATIAIVDASVMDLRDLVVLDSLVRRPTTRMSLGDFCWHRLRAWQELMARFFDQPETLSDLRAPRALRVSFQQRAKNPERTSTQAALFVGWLAARLGLRKVDWPSERRARLSSRTGEVLIDFEPVQCAGVVDGALVDVTLEAGAGRYRVHRAGEDSGVICWEGERPGVPFPNQCVRSGMPKDAELLDRVLQRPIRDPLYEASLAAASELVSGIG